MDLSVAALSFRILLLFLLLFFHVDRAMSRTTYNYINSSCDTINLYGSGSLFENNLGSLFKTLADEAYFGGGYAYDAVGVGSDEAYGQVQCRGDVDPDTCKACIKDSTQYFVGNSYCRYSMDAIVFYELCQLQYYTNALDDYSNLVYYKIDGYGIHYSGRQVDSELLYAFQGKLIHLLKELTFEATLDTTRHPKMFATGNISYYDQEMIFGLVQCTRGINGGDCKDCLDQTIGNISATSTCYSAQGCEIVTGSCRVRFDTDPAFYQSPAAPTTSPPVLHPSPSPSSLPNSASVASNITAG